MRKLYILLALAFVPLFFSCKRTVEKKKMDLVITAMTTGRWYVQEYISGTDNVTAEFDGYEFQFYSNGTVEGIKAAGTTAGTWAGDASAMTINSNFPSAGLPLKRLNGLWKITDNDWVYVHATLTSGGVTNTLKLHKK
ncbi:MAG TPA: hypothetical protein VD993_04280 [Chitinophagaceae bacterium]|nr:hypothetical protein [Chitinophagaceae bacterium]